ncbi:NAD-dependent epimerase/dehydratase family protein [Rhodococcus aetherivorans]|uniref:NAD-dependent epimerase/dehydratase family protein n=1 Tax=Rhodococcus aetherivorans TaxID=191292 RepID=UPI00045CC959|nr:NAD-dependent epimerase/dehydratase family protein [Rhodococcus aetherivorans]KDE12008.1 epimerase [Rhodococcus aetherivorans]
MRQRIVITGASGNVGTALLRRLARRSEPPEIVAVARRVPPPTDPYDGVTWHSVDLAAPGAETGLRPLIEGADAVVHLAWGFQPSHRRDYLRRTGVDGTAAVIGATLAAGVGHLVHMSSAAVYAAGAYGRAVDESWPATGIESCAYSVDKVAAERLLDERIEGAAAAPIVTRFRPGFIGQYAGGSALRRYAVPGYVPDVVLRHLPLLPVDPGTAIPAVHADDVAAALDAALERRVPGAFNLATPEPLRAGDIAGAFGARAIPVPRQVLRAVVEATWQVHLQPIAGGWIDLAYNTPMLDCDRARRDLDWAPTVPGPQVWREAIAGMQAEAGTDSPVLRSRGPLETMSVLLGRGTVGRRVPP